VVSNTLHVITFTFLRRPIITFFKMTFYAFFALLHTFSWTMSIALYGTIYRVIWRRIIVTWNLGYGHWRSFKLVPFQSVTSRRPSEIVLSLVCSGTVQVWWLMNGKSVADHSRHVVRRLQSSVIRTKTLIALPQTLYAAFWWGLNLISLLRGIIEGEGSGQCFHPQWLESDADKLC